jgi:2-oxo-4-hydroxy-4-carboxy--5-ureidoimidazoline (OHCU) decarboxylase
MKVEQQEPVIRFTVEITAEEWSGLKGELKELTTLNKRNDTEFAFPFIQQLVTNMDQS